MHEQSGKQWQWLASKRTPTGNYVKIIRQQQSGIDRKKREKEEKKHLESVAHTHKHEPKGINPF